jgi:dipeptidyl aminopeptidase/acylaminoacyl peptidase
MARSFRALRRTIVALSICVATPALALASGPKKGFTVDDMLAMQRISEPHVSPDGRLVAFTVRETDFEANRGRTDIWVATTDGAQVRRLTTHPDGDSSPRFTADGKTIYFLSSRSGSSQVWKISPAGGEAEQVTRVPLDVSGFVVFPDGKRLILAMDVYPDAKTLEETVKKEEQLASSKVKARVYDSLLFRHWDTWEDGKYSHLFAWSPEQPTKAVDLTPGQATDSPTHPFGGMEEVSISPDGKSVAFVARVGGREIAWTTNTDIFLTTTDGKGKPQNLTAASKAYDLSPSFSPDGKTIGYLAMSRPGYEADRQRVALIDVATKKIRVLTEGWDRSASGVSWSNDGKTIWTTADHIGNHALFAIDVATGSVKPLLDKGTLAGPQQAGERLLFARDTLASPVELYTSRLDGTEVRAVTSLNAERAAKIAWGEYEQFSFKGAKGDTVYGFVMKPANHASMPKGAKVPLAMLIHGGPQGSFGDHFHYRWNPQAYAGRGYGVVFIDFHGSTGYGQAFTDAIRGDWGGAPYEDLMTGLDAALQKYPWLDGNRAVALGASYGGYMINWINGRTDRFKALVCHNGNIDERMAYFDTEELWFPEWEHGGTPWEKPDGYQKHNPIDHVKNWKTPTLVVHSANDFRVVDTQGMSTFTALQRKGVASRLLYFPDENHWVLKPQNSKRWHEEVLGWIDLHTKNKAK